MAQDLVEAGVVPLTMGPMVVVQLEEAGVHAVCLESFNVATSVRSDARIMVPRDQLAEAARLLDEISNP